MGFNTMGIKFDVFARQGHPASLIPSPFRLRKIIFGFDSYFLLAVVKRDGKIRSTRDFDWKKLQFSSVRDRQQRQISDAEGKC